MFDFKSHIKKIIILGFYILMNSYLLFAQTDDSLRKNDTILFPSDFFDQNTAIDLELEFDIKSYTRKKDSIESFPATITYRLNSSTEIKKQLKIDTRGIYRRGHCYFPPYSLNFKKSELIDDLPSDINKVKVVTHCFSSNQYENYLLKEYLAYKLYNIITDYSFKVRLAKIKYVDTGRENKENTEWAFLIEPENVLAERLNAYPIKMDKMSHNYTDTLNATIMVFFQYMIANTDFSLTGRHNLKLIKLKDFTKPSIIPIPYDFDFSGLVNTYYALPSEDLGIKSVTERYYRGLCRSDDIYIQVIDLYLEKKTEIFSFILTCDFLDKKTKKYVISFIEDFYNEIGKPDFIEKKVKSTCF